MRLLLTIVVFCIGGSLLLAQTTMPYQLSAQKEAWITGAALPVSGVSIYLDKKMKPLTAEDVSLLNANDVNRLDRFTTKNFDKKIIKRSDVTMQSAFGLGFATNFIAPLVYNTSDSYGKQLGTLSMIWFETNLVNFALTELAKTTVKRSRPFLYGDKAPDDLRFTKDARKSFFSGHTSFSAANSFYAASVFTSYQKGNQWNPVIWGVASLPPLLAAIQRVRAGKHFPTDVAVGYIIGAACGILIPKLHEFTPVNTQGSIKSLGGSSSASSGMTVQLINVKMVL